MPRIQVYQLKIHKKIQFQTVNLIIIPKDPCLETNEIRHNHLGNIYDGRSVEKNIFWRSHVNSACIHEIPSVNSRVNTSTPFLPRMIKRGR